MTSHKLALITGGSSGIGFALAKLLVADGSDVCLLARNYGKLQASQQTLSQQSVRKDQKIEVISADVTNYETLAHVLDEWTADFDVPDLVINSAGVTYPGYFQDLDVETFHWLMDVNYFGTLHVLKCLIPKMIARGSGTIVNISSQAGLIGIFGYSGYGASKYAIQGLSDVLRAEMKPLGIKVSVVYPPDTQTPQLEFEKDLKPPETKALSANSSVLSADHVARTILKGVKKGKYLIIPGFEGKLLFRLTQLLGSLTYPVMDLLIRQAQKSKKSN
jgi:3-dehydrosphinganine reductase